MYQDKKSFPQNHRLSHLFCGLCRPLMGSIIGLIPLSMVYVQGVYVQGVYAQESTLSSIEEIVVTARKREENLQDTPIAITAFSGEDLETRNLDNLSGIGHFTPNLEFSIGSGNIGSASSAQVYIRGVGQVDTIITTDPGVGTYIDDVYYPRSIGSVMDLIDFQQVEVLKGPQGTLFGKNTIGGAINITSTKPGEERGGKISVTTGKFDRLDISGSADLPLIEDTLLTRISLSSRQRDGYMHVINDNNDMGNVDSLGARFQADWRASDQLQLLFTADYNRKRENSAPTTLLEIEPNAIFLGLWNALVAPTYGAGIQYDDRYITNDPYRTNGTGLSVSELDTSGLSTTINWTLNESYSMKFISAYRNQDAVYGLDSDGSPLAFQEQSVDEEEHFFSQEIQLNGTSFNDRLLWVVGGLYFQEKGSHDYDARLGMGLFNALEALPGAIIPLAEFTCPVFCAGGAGNPLNVFFDAEFLAQTDVAITSYAAFAHVTYDWTDQLSFSLGLRYTYDEKEMTSRVDRIVSGANIVDADVSEDWDDLSPKVSLEYRWNSDIMTYVSASKGYKSGGFNGRPSHQAAAETPFDPEYVWSYEVGLKSEFFNRRLIVNTATFFNRYKDIQLIHIGATPDGQLAAFINNAAGGEVKGFELELIASPTPSFLLLAGVGYLDAQYTKIDPAITAVTTSSEFNKTPEWSYNLGLQYNLSLASTGELIFRSDYSYRDKMQNTPDNIEALAQDGFGLLSASIAYQSVDRHWEVALFGTNLGDERYITNGLSIADTFGTINASYSRPREWGLKFNYTFQ